MDASVVLIILLDLFIWLIHNSFGSIKPILIFWFFCELKILLAKLPESSNNAIEMFILLFKHLNLISELVQFTSEFLLLFHPLLLVINKEFDPLFPIIMFIYSWWHWKIVVLPLVFLCLLPVQEERWWKASVVLNHDWRGPCFVILLNSYMVRIQMSVVCIGSFNVQVASRALTHSLILLVHCNLNALPVHLSPPIKSKLSTELFLVWINCLASPVGRFCFLIRYKWSPFGFTSLVNRVFVRYITVRLI